MKNVLLIADEKSILQELEISLKGAHHAYRIMTAVNKEEFTQVEKEKVNLLIIYLQMPATQEFELLAFVRSKIPEVPMIVISKFKDSELESKLVKYNISKLIENPVDFTELNELVEEVVIDNTLSNIHGVTLSTFLQLMSLEKKNCTLFIRSNAGNGKFFLKNGEMINAECRQLRGIEAAIEVLGWENTEIEMDQICRCDEVLINKGIESILLEAHRLKDEEIADGTESDIPSMLFNNGPDHSDDNKTIETSIARIFDQSLDHEPSTKIEEVVPPETLEMLMKDISGHKATEQCCLYDHDNILVKTETKTKCSQVDFDPSIFLLFTNQMENILGIGEFNWIQFSLASRNHYLFFKLHGCSLLVKLVRGARPQLLGTEYLNIVKKVISVH